MDTLNPLQHLPAHATFDPAKMTKIDCFRSPRLFVGLNCLEPSQVERTVLLVGIAPALGQ